MDELARAEIGALWSTAKSDDLRRIADIARRAFGLTSVLLLSTGDDRCRYMSGERVVEGPTFNPTICDTPLMLGDEVAGTSGKLAADRRVGTLRCIGERQWTDEDRALLHDLAACLSSLLACRHAATGAAAPSTPMTDVFATVAVIETEVPDGVGAHILLADDLDLNRKLIADMLSIEGHAVDSVADGAAAVKAAGENAYDIILMDMIMPGMDGMAATRAIRALPAPACDVPIVALTAHSLPEQLDNCRNAGVDAILTKPMSVAALTDVVAHWMRRGRHAA